jgi:hypothetical protein
VSRRARQHLPPGGGAASGGFLPISGSSGRLRLADAAFSPAAAPVASAAVETFQGLQFTGQNSASAVIDSIPNADTWTWSLGGTINLTERPCILTILERSASVFPSLLTVACGFVDNGDPKALAGNGWGMELGWTTGTSRRLVYLGRAGGAWSRTLGTASTALFGGDVHVRPHTHTDIAQGRVWPRNAAGGRSSGTGAAGTTIQFEGRMTHFFIAVLWNSTAGATPTITVDPSYWIGEATLAA